MNRTLIWAIAEKDMKSIWKTSKVWIGLILLPLLMGVAIPTAAVLVGRFGDLEAGGSAILNVLDQVTSDGGEAFPTVNHQFVYFFVNFLLAPFFMLIPVINALMIAVNSFVGEKERGTLESLLFAPIEVKDLFLGKLLASFIPAYASALVSFVLSGVIINALAYPMFGELLFPSANWLVMIFWVIPAFTVCTILVSVLVSARAKDFQEAQQYAGVIVLPIVGMLVGQATGVLIIGPLLMGILGAVLLLLSVVLLRWIARMNQRDVLFERQVQ